MSNMPLACGTIRQGCLQRHCLNAFIIFYAIVQEGHKSLSQLDQPGTLHKVVNIAHVYTV
jgi:hypothetical protein